MVMKVGSDSVPLLELIRRQLPLVANTHDCQNLLDEIDRRLRSGHPCNSLFESGFPGYRTRRLNRDLLQSIGRIEINEQGQIGC